MARDDAIAPECRPTDGETVCVTCETSIDPTERHPASVGTNGETVVYLFCSEACQTAWADAED